ncbi:MAG: hypothetical protein V1663_01400 [archaeon]
MKGKNYLIFGTSILITLGSFMGVRGAINKLESSVSNAPIVRTEFDIKDQEIGLRAIDAYFKAEDVRKWPCMLDMYRKIVESSNAFISDYHTPDGKIGLPDLDSDGLVGPQELENKK